MDDFTISSLCFEEIRERRYVYVDKTSHASRLLIGNSDTSFFLSRPRRFGKSLFLSTLKSALEGKSELFEGLALNPGNYGFEKRPVIHLDLSSVDSSTFADMNTGINRLLDESCKLNRIQPEFPKDDVFVNNFPLVIDELYDKYGKPIAILIDEYDKPMLDQLGNTDLADDIVEMFNTFYSIIKSGVSVRKICFVFLTGVTKIAATSIFSGGNDVTDISLDPKFSDVCGFTDDEIRRHYAKHLESLLPMYDASGNRINDLDSLIAEIRMKYDGYSWGDGTYRVLNPFSLIKFMKSRRFNNFWFNSGTPTFLVKLLRRDPNQASDIILKREHVLTVNDFNSVSVDNLPVIPLLLQTGYFTIERREGKRLFLGIPNTEVRTALSSLSFNLIAGQKDSIAINKLARDVRNAFGAANPGPDDIDLIRKCLVMTINCCSFHNLPRNDELPIEKERFYSSLFVLALVFADLDPRPEISTAEGRIDIGFVYPDRHAWILEIKHTPDESGIETRLAEARSQLDGKLYRNAFLSRHESVSEIIIVIAGRQNVHVELHGSFKQEDISGEISENDLAVPEKEPDKAAAGKGTRKAATGKAPRKAAAGKAPRKADAGKAPRKADAGKAPRKADAGKAPSKAAAGKATGRAAAGKGPGKTAAGKSAPGKLPKR